MTFANTTEFFINQSVDAVSAVLVTDRRTDDTGRFLVEYEGLVGDADVQIEGRVNKNFTFYSLLAGGAPITVADVVAATTVVLRTVTLMPEMRVRILNATAAPAPVLNIALVE